MIKLSAKPDVLSGCELGYGGPDGQPDVETVTVLR